MTFVELLDYLGVFVFAISGAMLAARKEMDIFGFVVLALMPAVGGGTLRDLVLGLPVFWVEETKYLLVAIAAAIITFFALQLVVRYQRYLDWFDAIGLAVFCALGASKTLAATDDAVLAVTMGVITAVAGGIIRDVIANVSPLVLHREVYATAAFAGSLSYVGAVFYLELGDSIAIAIAILAAFFVRASGIIFGLSLPTVSRSI